MSKTSKKFKKNDYSYEEEEEIFDIKTKVDKRKQRRFDRAIKTKDISALIENDDYFEDTWN